MLNYRIYFLLLLSVFLSVGLRAEELKPSATPEWIWGGAGDALEEADLKQTLTFKKEFELKEHLERCYLIVNCDDSAIVRVLLIRVVRLELLRSYLI